MAYFVEILYGVDVRGLLRNEILQLYTKSNENASNKGEFLTLKQIFPI